MKAEKKLEFNKRVWCFFNAYRGTLTGIFLTKEAAESKAKSDGNKLPNGALVYPDGIGQANALFKNKIVYGEAVKLNSCKREPLVVCTVYDYDRFVEESNQLKGN